MIRILLLLCFSAAGLAPAAQAHEFPCGPDGAAGRHQYFPPGSSAACDSGSPGYFDCERRRADAESLWMSGELAGAGECGHGMRFPQYRFGMTADDGCSCLDHFGHGHDALGY